ncbi:MAG: asparagine--tRNA ligase [Planctomycetaceae bacterium]|jgi:asparaginyl-tRNA synthetase|nr:asparagine--tRNA ligase [Phycisphaerales bacterium]MCE2654250.1 asparagine--tRNA ligase [Planctomycetaceae bacterium]
MAAGTWLRIADALKAPVGTAVTVKGWVRTRRDSKAEGGLSFVALHDGSCFDTIQLVITGSVGNYADEVTKLTTGCAIEADGVIVATPKGGVEIQVDPARNAGQGAVRVLGWVDDPDTYPIQPKPHSFEYLREVAHLRVRTNTFGAVARVRHCLAMAIHRFFHERGFYYVHTPIITASDCEGAGQMFRVSTLDVMNLPRTADGKAINFGEDFFGKESHLTVSGQLNVETYCMALSKVYTFGPTFRAENSNTSRHLAEFWMIEPEIAFADLAADAQLAEDMLKYLFTTVLTERADDMKFFAERIEKTAVDRLKHIVEKPFLRLTYTEGVKILEQAIAKGQKKFEFPVKWGTDLQSEHERFLTEEHFKQPVILTNYPKQIKAFYMRLDDNCEPDRQTVSAMDILVPGIGEIVGGSQREERLDRLDARISEMGLPIKEYWWYRDLRRYGTVPHAGFGLGFERLIQFVTGMQNIRDVIPFPRAPKQADF